MPPDVFSCVYLFFCSPFLHKHLHPLQSLITLPQPSLSTLILLHPFSFFNPSPPPFFFRLPVNNERCSPLYGCIQSLFPSFLQISREQWTLWSSVWLYWPDWPRWKAEEDTVAMVTAAVTDTVITDTAVTEEDLVAGMEDTWTTGTAMMTTGTADTGRQRLSSWLASVLNISLFPHN